MELKYYVVYFDVEIEADSEAEAEAIAKAAINGKWPEDQELEFSVSSVMELED